MLILQKKEDNISKIEWLFVKKIAKYKEKEDIFHKNKIEKCLFFKNCFNNWGVEVLPKHGFFCVTP